MVQLPADLIRIQEAIVRVGPDVIVETGVAHGGSLVYYASLCQLLGRGRVLGVDIRIEPANRAAIEQHPLAPLITLIEGDSTAPEVVSQVSSAIEPEAKVMVVLDSSHAREHVLAELEAYHRLVSSGSFIVATDGIMQDLHDVPSGNPEWRSDNPTAAAREFASLHPEFALRPPERPFDESEVAEDVTYWPAAWLQRL